MTRPPSELYWFGTDMLGRDVYSRVIYGTRVSLMVGFSVAICSTIIGTFIGVVRARTGSTTASMVTHMVINVPGAIGILVLH